jgi:RNA polymerase sigma-70 factor (ECF subfamily)
MNKEALIKIFDLYAPSLFNYARRLCGDPVMADHIVGDVFTKLLEQLSAGKGPRANLRSYLYQSTYHQIVDDARDSQRRAPLEVAESLRHATPSLFTGSEDPILLKQVVHAIHYELSDDQRHVIFLRFFEEFSLNETAAILGKHIDHVKVIQSRALATLRRSLKQQEVKKLMPSSRRKSFSKVLGA